MREEFSLEEYGWNKVCFEETFNKSLVINRKIIINFMDESITIDGERQEATVTETEKTILRWLADAPSSKANIKYLQEMLTSPISERSIQNELGRIKKMCKLECPLTKRKEANDSSYLVHPEVIFEWVDNFAVKTLHKSDIFYKPPVHYIEPKKWLDDIFKNAFCGDIRVHAITGERGLGKTELARRFASDCIKDAELRKKYRCPRFRNVIFTSYLEQGLEHTIALLKCTGHRENIDTFDKKIDLLRQIKKPTLLIIDNYDNTDVYREELSEDSSAYEELRNTGCHILFTSKIDLRDCFGLAQTKITKFTTDELVHLFLMLSYGGGDYADIVDLVDNCLMGNTYLVRLAARLTETRGVKEIIEAIKQLHTKEITDPIAGKENQHGSLFNNFVELFNLSSFKEDETMCKLLYNIALLPLEGMGYADFFNNAFSDEDRPKMQESFSVLRDSFWVFLDNRTITMHPMVREMFARKLVGFDYGYFERYVDAINIELTFDTYNPDISTRIKRGAAAFEIIEILGEENLNIACLVAKIASAYDIIGDKGLSYEYGVKALKLLIKAEEEAQNDGQKYELAYAYNIIGYSILHSYTKMDSIKYAQKALNKSHDIILKISENKVQEVKLLKTINQGDTAALCLRKKDYQGALEIHRDNIKLRKAMCEEDSKQENKKLLAASYKGVATASYYLAKESENEDEKKKYLIDSYNNHEESIKYYKEAYYPDYHFEVAVATNRQVGTLRSLMEYLSDNEKRTCLEESLERIKEAQEYLEDMEPKNKSELKICKENLEQLEKMCKKDSLFAHFDIRDVGKEQSEKLSKNDIIGSVKNR